MYSDSGSSFSLSRLTILLSLFITSQQTPLHKFGFLSLTFINQCQLIHGFCRVFRMGINRTNGIIVTENVIQFLFALEFSSLDSVMLRMYAKRLLIIRYRRYGLVRGSNVDNSIELEVINNNLLLQSALSKWFAYFPEIFTRIFDYSSQNKHLNVLQAKLLSSNPLLRRMEFWMLKKWFE